MPAFNLTTVGQALQQAGQETSAIFQQIAGLMQTDPATGTITVDETQLRAILAGVMLPDSASVFVNNLFEVAQGGMLMLESSAVPWLVLEDLAYARQGTPEPIKRELLGRMPLALQSPDMIRARLSERFPSAPDTIFSGEGAELLIRAPYRIPFPSSITPGPSSMPRLSTLLPSGEGPAIPDFDPEEERPSRPHTTGSTSVSIGWETTASGIVAPSPEKTLETARCLLNGAWDGVVRGLPFGAGWALGWSCCISQDCAEQLANLLAGLGGAEALLAAAAALYAGGIAAAVAAVTALPALTVLAIYGFALSLNIRAVNGPNGVCIYGNWPWVVGMYVWALPT